MNHEMAGSEQPGSILNMAPSWLAMLPWPLTVMDFEASSLEHDSYPVEVGLACWAAPGQPILVWSTLIRPAGEWTRRGH